MNPERIRLSRLPGFNLQIKSRRTNGLAAVNVARPGMWGNPFLVGPHGSREHCVSMFRFGLRVAALRPPGIMVPPWAHMVFHSLERLRGANVACWCKLGELCHGDVLLELANAKGWWVMEPKSLDEFITRSEISHRVEMHDGIRHNVIPCPACGASDFIRVPEGDSIKVEAKGATCHECRRTFRAVYTFSGELVVDSEIVQIAGDDPPEFLPRYFKRLH